MKKIKAIFLSLIMALGLTFLPVGTAFAAVCTYPPEMNMGGAIAKEGSLMTKDGRIYKCINGEWIVTIETTHEPTKDRTWVHSPGNVAVGQGWGWVNANKQAYSVAGNPIDPNNRTSANTWAIFFSANQEIIDPVSGETSYNSYDAVHFSGDNLAPGETYYAFATKQQWDPTPNTGWDTQNGEALALQSTNGSGYATVTADANGMADVTSLQPPAGYGWNYVRLVAVGGGGRCSAPVDI